MTERTSTQSVSPAHPYLWGRGGGVMAVCQGTRRDGTPCMIRARTGERWCYHHDPALAKSRRT